MAYTHRSLFRPFLIPSASISSTACSSAASFAWPALLLIYFRLLKTALSQRTNSSPTASCHASHPPSKHIILNDTQHNPNTIQYYPFTKETKTTLPPRFSATSCFRIYLSIFQPFCESEFSSQTVEVSFHSHFQKST